MKFCTECHNMYYLKVSDDDSETVSNILIYYCRNCGYEEITSNEGSICVSDIELKRGEKKYTHAVNEYTKYDPTLPRINTIKCPNQECVSNQLGGGGSGQKSKTKSSSMKEINNSVNSANKSAADALESAEKAQQIADELAQEAKETKITEKSNLEEKHNMIDNGNSNREVIYIRYDDINMKYVYVCVNCNTTWKTDTN